MAQTRYPACSPGVHAVDALALSGMCYYDNGAVKIGIHLEIGGAITNLVHAAFEVIPDGAMRTYTIDLSKVEGYTGIGTRFVLIPKTDGAEGRNVTIARLGRVR